ncbi:MAG TPA: integrase family protein [Candidatus Obscuribacterales bacterium]
MADSRRFNFRKKDIEAIELPEDGKQQERYYDTKTRGLFLLVTAAGAKTFYVRRKVKGKSELYMLGRFPELTVEQARAKASGFHSALTDGKNLIEARRADRAELSLGELFEIYLEQHLKKSRKTWKVLQQNFVRDYGHWKNHKLSAITRADVERLHAVIGQRRGRYAANRAIDLLRAMYNKGIRWNLHKGDNPAVGISEFTEQPRDRVLQPSEVKRFFKALDEEQDANFKDFVALCLYTGQRKSNVPSMRWRDIDMKGRLWNIPGERMKNGQALTLALSPAELEILNRRHKHANGEYVFPGEGRTGHFVEPKRAWARLLKRADIEDLHIHDLRRSLASFMANTGADVSMIKSALNHKDVKTTLSVYVRTARSAELSARQKAHDLIKKLADEPKRKR